MRPARKKRLTLVLLLVLAVGAAVALGVNAFRSNLLYFFTPTQVAAGEAPLEKSIRVGGMVVEGSVVRDDKTLDVSFDLTDYAATISVRHNGILPDLFREGQGIVAIGSVGEDGVIAAKQVLAKHDENYMPPEVADALEQAGQMPGTTAFDKPAETTQQ